MGGNGRNRVTEAVEHLRRALAMLEPLSDEGMTFGVEVYAKAADAQTEIRDAIFAIGADPWLGD